MAAKISIDLYCLCWNDARMLPHFFRHYDTLVDRYFILDNGSTDASLEILQSHPKVTVSHFDVSGDSFVDEERRLSDSIWRKSKNAADWVIMVDIDEFIFRPDLKEYLGRCTEAGVTAIRAIGYEMVADFFPTDGTPLTTSVTLGVRSAGHDKLCIFNPAALTETHFEPGRHKANPKGRVVWPERPEVLMLHYKQLGVEYTIRRSAELRQGLKGGDLENGWGKQYLWGAAEIADRWAKLRADAGPVPGLGTLSRIDSVDYDEDHAVAESGLFDAAWYLASYPDVVAEDANALSHFCIHGWKEGRKPNFYFQPEEYLQNNPAVRDSGRNPLLHYFVQGERAGSKPSPWFDPIWYRDHYQLDEAASPLAHYLANRSSGRFSPNPDFDVLQYCAAHPRDADGSGDPFEEHVLANQASESVESVVSEPSIALAPFSELLERLGIDPEPPGLREALRPLLEHIYVDEQRYRQAYPDVEVAVQEKVYDSGRAHFVQHGYFEGRSPRPDIGE